jgi:predicted transcriptional regulator
MAQSAPPALHIRMPPWLRRALEQAAKAEDRPVSALARRIIADWLKRHAETRT